MAKFIDDQYDHLVSDVDKMRVRHRQYISYSNEQGAKSVVDEIIQNCLDECKNPRSPGNKIHIEFDDNTGFITVIDNGRGIPSNILEKLYTSLNMGSNINTKNKSNMKTDNLGQNGTGTLAICALAERVEITSYRGGTENIFRKLIFEEGKKVDDITGNKCPQDQHGMMIVYKPSKVMGKNTKIIWDQVSYTLDNLRYLNKKKINIDSVYTNLNGEVSHVKYKQAPFEDILYRNNKDSITSNRIMITIDDDNIMEELDGESVKRFISMDIAFVYTSSLTPYIDSFSNSSNTVDNGDHLDGALEAICRFFQINTKNTLSEKEKNSLDIKWDDVKTGLSLVVALRTNYESLYTGQTKHKVVSNEIKRIIVNLTNDALASYFDKNPSQLRELCAIVKMNAKVRREGDKIRTTVVKNTLTNWSSFRMKNYDPCTRKGVKEYKELFIIEGDSAKGSLKPARDPEFQALFAIRGVSANVYKKSLHELIGNNGNGNREFINLITVMGCNVGSKFDLNKLQFKKIIITSDADVDGLFIRSLLLAFYFKVFPEIILDGRLYIAEPPLYRVDDNKNPFVKNKEDYINRYINAASKSYKLGIVDKDIVSWVDKSKLREFLTSTSTYVDDLSMVSMHYNINDRLLEMILEEFAWLKTYNVNDIINSKYKDFDPIQHLMNRIGEEFQEVYFDDNDKMIKGVIDGRYQLIEITDQLVKKSRSVIDVITEWGPVGNTTLILKDIKTSTEYTLSLLGILKILKKFQPRILHRFKGLGENSDDDIKTTIMDPNTRSLIKVNISDIENDMKTFQLLRGKTAMDLLGRREMMKDFVCPKELIDT